MKEGFKKMNLDPEVIALAELELGNAFYRAFGQFVADYMAAAKGLDEDRFEERLSTMSNVYAAYWHHNAARPLAIATSNANGDVRQHETIAQALQCDGAKRVVLQGRVVFEWDDEIGWRLPP